MDVRNLCGFSTFLCVFIWLPLMHYYVKVLYDVNINSSNAVLFIQVYLSGVNTAKNFS